MPYRAIIAQCGGKKVTSRCHGVSYARGADLHNFAFTVIIVAYEFIDH
jgi:hypothetical protein